MSRGFLALICVLVLAGTLFAPNVNDPNEGAVFTHDSGSHYTFSWWGRSGRTYFLQHSEDLQTWIYFPDVIESGANWPLSYGFSVSGPSRFFLRLRYTNIPTGNPSAADFDGDGLSNFDELQRGTDPLNPDTDGDGVNDGIEVLQGRNPLKGAITDTADYVGLVVFTALE